MEEKKLRMAALSNCLKVKGIKENPYQSVVHYQRATYWPKAISFVCSIFLVFTTVTSNAQLNIFDEEISRDVIINEPNGYIKVSVLITDKELKANINLIYHWYHSNRIMSTQGGYDGKLLHGDYVSFYENKQLKEKGQFTYGLKNGRWTGWYENGKVKAVSHWSEGQLNGVLREYSWSGEMVRRQMYDDGSEVKEEEKKKFRLFKKKDPL